LFLDYLFRNNSEGNTSKLFAYNSSLRVPVGIRSSENIAALSAGLQGAEVISKNTGVGTAAPSAR
jgi:hypothetical protein